MPLSKEHKQKSKEKILQSAVQLFTHKGFNKVSIDEVMQHAGMTRGAFYAHFDSKESLYSEAILAGTFNSLIYQHKNAGTLEEVPLFDIISVYLSKDHLKRKSSPCMLAFMATDVANEEKQVRQTYTKVFEGFIRVIEETSGNSNINTENAMAIAAMMIGSIAVGRALSNDKLAFQLLESSKEMAGFVLDNY